MRTGVIVQMRLDSSRLPRKALLPLGTGTLASMVMQRLRGLAVDEYILATDPESADFLEAIALSCGFQFFAGSKHDVLDRYIKAAEAFDLERVVRATGDNPLVSTELGTLLISSVQALEEVTAEPVDYAGHIGMPLGLGVELVRVCALRKAAAESTDPYDHEHVCPYLYRNPSSFRIELLSCPSGYGFPDTRLTIDTADDYRRLQAVFSALGPSPTDAEVMAYLRASNSGAFNV